MSVTAHELRMWAADKHQELFKELDMLLIDAAINGKYAITYFAKYNQWDAILAYCLELNFLTRCYPQGNVIKIIISFSDRPSNTIIQ